ncbi:MAG: DUF190 domain-containing protein [Nitrospirota bacterium]
MKKGAMKKLSIYVDETDRVDGRPVYEVVMDILYRNKVAGASAFRGVAGYGSDRVFHTSKLLELSTTLPIKIEAIDSEEVINKVLPAISGAVEKGLVEISDVVVL